MNRQNDEQKKSNARLALIIAVILVVPFLILVVMSMSATKVLVDVEDTTKSDLTIKITAYQWKWGYEYMDGSDINFYSALSTPRTQIDQFNTETVTEISESYLLETDKALIVPSDRKVRALITANDVIHAWWVPAFGVKKDAIPGYINELWFRVSKGNEGVYRGNCAELCGKDHAYMPIVVQVVSGAEFDQWVVEGGKFNAEGFAKIDSASMVEQLADAVEPATAEQSSIAEPVIEAVLPSAEGELSIEDLVATGQKVYGAHCKACHQDDGSGLQGFFPAITGSELATGPADDQIELILNGAPGTAMAAFGNLLNDEEIAAVITYQRNALGNSVGDSVQAADVAAKR